MKFLSLVVAMVLIPSIFIFNGMKFTVAESTIRSNSWYIITYIQNNNDSKCIFMHGTIQTQYPGQTHADNTHLMAMIINILNLLELQFGISLLFIFMACMALRLSAVKMQERDMSLNEKKIYINRPAPTTLRKWIKSSFICSMLYGSVSVCLNAVWAYFKTENVSTVLILNTVETYKDNNNKAMKT